MTPAGDPGVPEVDLAQWPAADLLRLYARILDELLARKVIRSRNAPAGDLAEYLVQRWCGGTLAPQSEKSWDVQTPDRQRLQVKARVVSSADPARQVYSPFRSWDFHSCVFIVFDAHSYAVTAAIHVPRQGLELIARKSNWLNGWRVWTTTPLGQVNGARDITDELRQVVTDLDRGERLHPS